jgi:ribonuclease HI
MEMTAVIESLKSLNNYINDKNDSNDTTAKSSCLIITDSRYVCDNWNDYFETWKSTGWRKSNGKPVLNVDLWKAIEKEISNFQSVEFQWVKGHDVNQYNQKADLIACGNITALRRLTCSK